MATNVSKNTFLSLYDDDYRDSDHYHRILFNNGRALQARELTQMQTIIQKEIERLAKFVVTEGSIFNNQGTLAAGTNAFSYTYLKIVSLPSGYVGLKNTQIDSNNKLFATVKAVLPDNTDTETPSGVVIVKMSKGDGSNSNNPTDASFPKDFDKGSVISTTLGNMTILNTNDAVGKSSLVETPAFDTFAAGHLVSTEAQTLVLDKFSNKATATVGFKVTQQVITASDNVELYDNSGATPNLTSPGADRLKITLTLVKESDTTADDIFYPIYRIVSGRTTSVKTSDKTLARLGDIINARTYSITGDFVEKKSTGMFELTINNDSTSNDFLSVEVASGTGFVNGAKISKEYSVPFRVKKPNDASVSSNIQTVNNEFVGVNYGNYFLSNEDSTKGLVSRFEDSYGHILLYDQRDLGGTQIGEARVRHLDKVGNEFRTHVFDVELNSGKSFNQIRSIGLNSTNVANLKSINGDFSLYARDDNNLLFPLEKERVNEASNITMVVGNVQSKTKSAGAPVTFTPQIGNTFADVDQWIVTMDSSGLIQSPPTPSAGGTGFALASFETIPKGSSKTLTYENVTAVRKEKTLTPAISTGNYQIDSNLSLTNGEFTLTKTDIYDFHQVIDDQTKSDISYKFLFDNGQRDNYYDAGRGRLKSGASAPGGTIHVKYRYFSHEALGGDVGYFDAKSYVGVDYDDIPYYHARNGEAYRLSDVIDMRPMKNPANNKFSGGISRVTKLPRPSDTLTVGTAKYWNPRHDVISLSPNGNLTYHIGTPSTNPAMPTDIPDENMILHEIMMNAYTLNKNDVATKTLDNRGFKMSHIRNMERRLDNLENMVTLTASEAALAGLQVLDPNDATVIRETQGLSGDGFYNTAQSAVYDPDYRARLYNNVGILSPLQFERAIDLTYDSDASSSTVIKGSTVWPTFTEEVASFSQQNATRFENVNQFEIATHIASGLVIPEGDYWTVRRKVDESYTSEYNESRIREDGTVIYSQTNSDPGYSSEVE